MSHNQQDAIRNARNRFLTIAADVTKANDIIKTIRHIPINIVGDAFNVEPPPFYGERPDVLVPGLVDQKLQYLSTWEEGAKSKLSLLGVLDDRERTPILLKHKDKSILMAKDDGSQLYKLADNVTDLVDGCFNIEFICEVLLL